jgi:hypothetical protein
VEDLLGEYNTWEKNCFPAFRLQHPRMQMAEMMLEMLSGHPSYSAYSTMRELFAVALTQTVATAIVESGYSTINAVKDYKTNGLNDETLDDILNLLFNGPPEMPVCVDCVFVIIVCSFFLFLVLYFCYFCLFSIFFVLFFFE